MAYPVNYGFVDRVIADDDEQGAYVLVIDEPIESFEGEALTRQS